MLQRFSLLGLVFCLGCPAPPTTTPDAGLSEQDGGTSEPDGGNILPDGGFSNVCVPTTEICDGLDNDCNGTSDDGLTSCDVCSDAYHELPVITHWSNTHNNDTYLGTDQPTVLATATGPFSAGQCYPYYAGNRTPDLDRYVGDTWSTSAIPDAEAKAVFRRICQAAGVPLRLLRPDAVGTNRLRSNAGAVQIVHANMVDGSLVTVVLPANWKQGEPDGRYPIVANGFYDLNDNVFRNEGPDLLRMIALSSTNGRTGAIGVLWNGGGALATHTASQKSFDQFAHVIDFVAQRFSGDRQRILMYGTSRGGLTALAMASNPKQHDYRVIFAASVVPFPRLGEHVFAASSTFPGILWASTWSTGFHNAWQSGWVYPACAQRPHLTGRSAPEAHLYVLTGTTDPDFADTHYSLVSPPMLNGLKAAGTKVYLQVGSHDVYVPYAHQVEYGTKLFGTGIPTEVDVLIRAGHASRTEMGKPFEPAQINKIWEALQFEIDPTKAQQQIPFSPGVHYYKVNRGSKFLEPFVPTDGKYPFTMEGPRVTARGQRFPIVLVGEVGTDWEVTLSPPTGPVQTWTGTIGPDMRSLQWVVVPNTTPLGNHVYGLRIRKPGMSTFQTIPSTFTTDGSLASVSVAQGEPSVTGDEILSLFRAPVVSSFPSTNWGLSEY